MATFSEVKNNLLDVINTKVGDPDISAGELAALAGALQTLTYTQEPKTPRTRKAKDVQ